MRRLRWAAVFLAPALVFFTAQAGAAKPRASKVKQTTRPLWTLAMNGSRVVYASGTKIRVWNVATGVTSVVRGHYASRTGNVTAAQVAIAGRRVAWIKREGLGNTEAKEQLYTATIGGRAHLRAHSYRYGRDDPAATTGSWIAGVVGSGKTLAVSTWKSNGTTSHNERLSRITPSGLKPIVTGPSAIVAESVDRGRLAVLRSTGAWPYDTGPPLSPAPTAGIYSVTGTLLGKVALTPPDPLTAGIEIALSGNRLVVLTTELQEPGAHMTATLQVYDWRTGELEHTWSFALKIYSGVHALAVYGHLAAVESASGLHLVDLDTGKDVKFAPASFTDSPAAIDSRGLVYTLGHKIRGPGKLVFVPMAKLLAAVS